MSDRADRNAAGKRNPEQKRMNPGDQASSKDKESLLAHLKSTQSLERLRNKVEAAARELKRLHEENRALSARIAELESQPRHSGEGTLVPFSEDPEALRRKVESFIEAIDRYLDHENKS